MTVLEWDAVGSRGFEAGLDRGVIYLEDGSAVAWSGLTEVTENGSDSAVEYYMDGRPFLYRPKPKEFKASISAVTYPDELNELMGYAEVIDGLFFDGQQGGTFNLSYRTRVGNDVLGIDAGYKIHIIYGATITNPERTYASLAQDTNPLILQWEIAALPQSIEGYRTMAHIAIQSNGIDPSILTDLEERLYGAPSSAPNLPTLQEVYDILKFGDAITVTDNGDGTIDIESSHENVVDNGDGTFTLNNSNARVNHLKNGSFETSELIWQNWFDTSVSLSSTLARSGAKSLKMVSTNTGLIAARTFAPNLIPIASSGPIKPGDTLYFSGFPRTDGPSRVSYLELHWLRANGTEISFVAGNYVTASVKTGRWNRIRVQGVAPADAVSVQLVWLIAGVSSVGETFYLDDAVVETSEYINLMPDPGFEVTPSATWLGSDTNNTATRSTAQKRLSTYSYEITTLAPGYAGIGTNLGNGMVVVQPNTQYTVSIYAKAAALASRVSQMFVLHYSAAASYLSSSNGAVMTISSADWTRNVITFTTPSTCELIRLGVALDGATVAGEKFYLADVLVQPGSTLNEYREPTEYGYFEVTSSS